MRILFDQGTPAPLRHALVGHTVETAFELGSGTLHGSRSDGKGSKPSQMIDYRFLLPAEEEMTEASQFYEAASAGLGTEFPDDVQRVTTAVCESPLLGLEVRGKLRREVGGYDIPTSANSGREVTMSTVTAEIEAKIRTLSPDEKANLIRSLIAELDGPADPDVDVAWVKEAQRRHREVAGEKVQPVPGEQVFAKLRERLKR